jgi:hypothetical protein
MHTPYTYLIGWSNLDKWYYGVRWVEGCHPNDFWKDYYTSSHYVKMFRDVFGEPDVIEIRKTFDSPEQARKWEFRVITKMKMSESKKWLNQTDLVKSKVSLDDLKHYRDLGETFETIAKRFGITRQAVHYRLKGIS